MNSPNYDSKNLIQINRSKPNNHKIGIVVVSYNASLAVRITLASLRMAKNNVPFELILLDNASKISERKKIKTAFNQHRDKVWNSWKYIQLNENIGFSRANNIGIKEFLDKESVSHICLLNSDVLVTDHWLDRLINKDFGITSPVSNRSDSTQIVPIDYSIDIEACLNNKQEKIKTKIYKIIEEFSDKRHAAWLGNTVAVDHVTFFCALISKETISQVGLLDENFFPGGYEDNDYCMRANKLDLKIGLVRDNFIHHWGSASFGQLSREYFNEHALENRHYLERKHNIKWEPRPENPFISFGFDAIYTLKENKGDPVKQIVLFKLYEKELSVVLDHELAEYVNLKSKIDQENIRISLELQRRISEIEGKNIKTQFNDLILGIIKFIEQGTGNSKQKLSLLSEFGEFIDKVRKFYTCIKEMIQVLGFESIKLKSAQTNLNRRNFKQLVRFLRKGVHYLTTFDGLVIFGGYPYKFRENDGYFQRIKAIDKILTSKKRVYIDNVYLPNRSFWYDQPDSNVLVINIIGRRIRKFLSILFASFFILRTRIIYFHSILALRRFKLLYYFPFIKKIMDLHGAVPEEFLYHDDFDNNHAYEKIEALAVRKSDHIIVVTNAMQQHISRKYKGISQEKFIILPILQIDLVKNKNLQYQKGRPVIIYAGGLQKWQQVPKMINAIKETYNSYNYKFFTPNPDEFRTLLPSELRDLKTIEIDTKTKNELVDEYRISNYGLILREDIVVNKVACPTKLVEYLAMGVLPIIDTDKIGDFVDLGMEYININQLVNKNLPDEETWMKMVKKNFSVFDSLYDQFQKGVRKLQSIFFTE